jgi:hypothetical protein
MYSFSKLLNTFRVGTAVWCSNNATVSRLLACVAFNLATGRSNENQNVAYTYSMFSRNTDCMKYILEGLQYPEFYEDAMRILIEDSEKGIIWKRELHHAFNYFSIYYDRQSKYTCQSISIDFNQSGPRVFLREKKMLRYFEECCRLHAQGMIENIIYFDTEMDELDSALDSICLDDRESDYDEDPHYNGYQD